MPVIALCAIIAPGSLAAVLLAVLGDHLRPQIRVVLAVGGLCGFALSLSRGLIRRLLDALNARFRRVPAGEALPSQRTILRSFWLGLAATVCNGLEYAVLLDVGDAHSRAVIALSFVVSFTIGFLVLPAPSGLGVREAALIALLLGVAPVASLLAAAVAVRIIQVTAELTLAGAAAVASRLHRHPRSRRDGAVDSS
jgi:uncharacterized membrane protein YbhN (UPF0104 family)